MAGAHPQAYLRRAEVLPEGVFRAKAKWYKQYVNPAFVLSGDMSDAAPPVPPPVPSGTFLTGLASSRLQWIALDWGFSYFEVSAL